MFADPYHDFYSDLGRFTQFLQLKNASPMTDGRTDPPYGDEWTYLKTKILRSDTQKSRQAGRQAGRRIGSQSRFIVGEKYRIAERQMKEAVEDTTYIAQMF